MTAASGEPFSVLPGPTGLDPADVAHLLIPGRGRTGSGEDISTSSYDRVHVACQVFQRWKLGRQGGRIVCAGYKTPADDHGSPHEFDDLPGRVFTGLPEADGMRRALLADGVPAAAIRVERESIDSVTNLVRAEAGDLFGDDRPVAIVAQLAHLLRLQRIIAPRTLRREYLGVVVPEAVPDREGRLPALASRLILLRMNPYHPDIVRVTDRRAQRLWRVHALLARRGESTYHTDS
jgi:DUF218 domain-containing protein